MTIRMGVVASDPEEASKKMRAYLATLPKKTPEEEAWWAAHMRKAASVWRPKPGDHRRVSARTVDPLSDPGAAA